MVSFYQYVLILSKLLEVMYVCALVRDWFVIKGITHEATVWLLRAICECCKYQAQANMERLK